MCRCTQTQTNHIFILFIFFPPSMLSVNFTAHFMQIVMKKPPTWLLTYYKKMWPLKIWRVQKNHPFTLQTSHVYRFTSAPFIWFYSYNLFSFLDKNSIQEALGCRLFTENRLVTFVRCQGEELVLSTNQNNSQNCGLVTNHRPRSWMKYFMVLKLPIKGCDNSSSLYQVSLGCNPWF